MQHPRSLLIGGVLASALGGGALAGEEEPAPRPGPPLLREVGFDQHLGATLPLEIELVDESGTTVRLGDLFGERPVVLALVYYRCPMLCTLVLDGLVRSARAVSFDAGREWDVVAVSIDPTEPPDRAAAKEAAYVASYGRAGAAAGFHFLTGREESVRALAASVGFRYAYDSETREYAHPSGIVVATAKGEISRYLFGIEYAPRDLKLALVEASAGRIGGLVEQLLLICFHYDPASGRYGLAIFTVLRALGAGTVLLIGGFVLWHLRRERRRLGAAAHAARAAGAAGITGGS